MCLEVGATFAGEWSRDEMRLEFSEAAFRKYKATGEAVRGNSSLAEQRASASTRSDVAGAWTSA